jgi:hypothetical protein
VNGSEEKFIFGDDLYQRLSVIATDRRHAIHRGWGPTDESPVMLLSFK